MKNSILVIILFLSFSLRAQLTVNSGVNANDLVTAISGQGVIITNATLNCPNGAYATFAGGTGNLGLASGILLTTGSAVTAIGPNDAGSDGVCNGTTLNDPQLTSIEPNATNDVCVLEFDVVPQCTQLTLDYVFGSEEYPEYVGAGVNDAFGFFLSGPNPSGGNYTNINVAILPAGAGPVSIDNVNSGSNPSYYVDNSSGTSTQYDGLTTLLTANMPVVQCATYHMKLIIGDGGDCIYDSGVFLDFEGLNCPNSDAQLVAIDTQSAEGCGTASFQITANFAVPTTVNITSIGTATNGVDFVTPGSYNLPAGASTTNVTISPIADGIIEGTENANIILSYSVCGTLVYDTIAITILDQPTINFNSTAETCGVCDGTASATFSNAALPIASMVWAPAPSGGQGTANATGLCQGNYILSIVDANGCPATDTVTIGTTCPTCLISNFTAVQGVCENPLNVYDVTGTVTFTNAPTSGTLTVTACDGTNQVFNAPFASPINYTLNNLPANSVACSVTAVFSVDPLCTQTINFNNQAPCDLPCAFTSIADTVGACDLVTNDFIRSGQVTFTNAPTTGTLTLTDCLGNTQTFNAPFTSPTYYSLTINSNGTANCAITATFSADPACTINTAKSYPVSCACPADAGTTSAGVFGSGLNDYILCSGDTIIIVSDGNETNPNDVGVIGTSTYDPGITYGIYSCPPTPNTNPELDACFTGFVTGTIGSFGDINDGTLLAFLIGQGLTFTNNIIYYAPVTLYNQNDLVYNVNCVDVGLPIAVQYLPQVVSSNPTENCVNGTFTITINGGLPELDGSNFTASNLLPATASFVNTTTTNGGTIQINNLQNGDNYSFDVADANGCPITITGGPFTGLPTANAGIDDTSCTLTYNLNATPSIGTGLWTGPANISFSNTTSPTAIATSTTAGTYDLYWTESNGAGCSTEDTVQITFLNPITTLVVEDCQDSSITVTITNGLPEQDGSNYTVSNLLPATSFFTTSVATHAGDVIAQGLQNGDMYSFDISDNFGCSTSITGGPFTGLPTANAGIDDTSCTLTYNLNATPSIGTGLWTGPANISFSNTTSPTATATSTTAGTYDLYWTESNGAGCTNTDTVNITFTQMSIPNVLTHISCNGGNDGQVVVAPQGGIPPYAYSWSTSSNITPVENNLSAGTITVTVTDAADCTLDSTFTLTQPAAFGVAITSTTPVTCNAGNNGQATANVADVTTTYTYSWNTTPTNQNTATATNLTAGTYTVTATQATSGCTDTATITITEPTVVTIATISNDTTICSGQSTTITATATGGSGSGYIYTWNNGLGNGQNQTVTPLANTITTYQVSVVDGNGCPSNTQQVTVTVHPNLSVIASADETICPTTSTTISATPSFGNGGPYTYTWTPNTNISSTTAQSPIVTPTATTTYTVTLSDGCSPPVQDNVTITLWTLPVPLAQPDTFSLCIEPKQAITFYNLTDTANGMLDTNQVFWNFGDGSPLVNQPYDTLTHTYNQPGTYTVTMTVYSMPSQGSCPVTDTVISQINIYDLPIADFIATPEITSMFEPEIQFYDQSGSTIGYYYWDFAGLDSSNYPSPLYIFPDDTNGVYPVKLTVTDNHGCVDTITKIVTITGEYGIYIPNAFTPDFDGKNDVFGPKGFGISPENYHFMIFDRWGEKLFDTDILFKPWDGFYKGTRVQSDVYVWKLFFKDINNKKHERIGHVTIIQ